MNRIASLSFFSRLLVVRHGTHFTGHGICAPDGSTRRARFENMQTQTQAPEEPSVKAL